MTGTRAYGPVRSKSDYDFVVPLWLMPTIEQVLKKENIKMELNSEINENYKGIKFSFGGIEINIIVAANLEELECWKVATDKMTSLLPIHDREERIKTFRKFYNDENKKIDERYNNFKL
jgi:hypothetical protein